MRKTKPLVGIAIWTATSYGREIVLGVMRYANIQRKWLFLEDFYGQFVDSAHWSRCDGMIVPYMPREELIRLDAMIPHVVCVSSGIDYEKIPVVCIDDTEIGRLAAEHLIDCRLQNFGFYSLRGHSYLVAERRFAGFKMALAARGFSCAHYDHPPRADVATPGQTPEAHWPAAAEWLNSLPMPVGILCTEDRAARDLAAVCLHAGISVPERVAIIGINNDELLCESAWPPISSVDTDFDRVGYIAAAKLDRLMSGGALAEDEFVTRLPPAGVYRRASTDVLAVDDPVLAEAMRYIRLHACDPCTVEDIVKHVAIARRRLEKLSVAKLGLTLHDQMASVRLQTARRLLLQSDLDIPAVAASCGFSTTHFNRVFLDATRMTPTAWRNSQLTTPPGGAAARRGRLNSPPAK